MTSERINILITNIHSSMNAGDLALLQCCIQQLREAFPNPNFILSVNWPNEPYFQQNEFEVIPSPWVVTGTTTGLPVWKQIPKFILWLAQAKIFSQLHIPRKFKDQKLSQMLDAYQRADLVVGVAGNQFYSTGKYGWPFPVTLSAVMLAHFFQKPFYTMPQSIGPLRRFWERWLLKWVYSHALVIHMRDQKSMELAQQIRLPEEKVFYTPDPAFNLQPAGEARALEIMKGFGYDPAKGAIGTTIIATMGRSLSQAKVQNYYHSIAAAFRQIIEEFSVQLFFFNQVTGPTEFERDLNGAQQVYRNLGQYQPYARIVETDLSPAELEACYGLMDLFVPTRLHSGIFALNMGVPTLFIGYLTKTRGVLESLGLESWMIELADLNEQILVEKLRKAWLERTQRAAALESIMPEVVQASQSAGKRIAEDYSTNGCSKN